MAKLQTAKRTHGFTESVIREMTRLADSHGAVNLSQGFPDFPAPDVVKEAACTAVLDDVNQYSVTWGSPAFRSAIAEKFAQVYGVPVDSDTEVTVCCGSTEAMVSTLLALVDPGDEIVIFEPFYENYGPDVLLSGATPRYVTLREPDWTFDPDELASAFNNRTKAIIINTPNNPTGKVFSRDELTTIARLCQQWGVLASTADQTVTISSLSKTYSVTGWRVGWAIAPAWLTAGIRKVHDFLTVGAAAPLQAAGVTALELPGDFYADLVAGYARRRTLLLEILERHEFTCYPPQGAYYIMTDIAGFGFDDDVAFARYMTCEVGVAVVPGSSFYHDPALGRTKVRFTFCKQLETLEEAARRLQAVMARSGVKPV